MSKSKQVIVLGATGSIGRSTCDVVRHRPDAFQITALAASRDVEGLLELTREFRPEVVALSDPAAARKASDALEGSGVAVLTGPEGVERLASWPRGDLVVNAIVGAAGLRSSMATLAAGRILALANKESLVAAGELVTSEAARTGGTILPIDSEHCSLFQCIHGRERDEIREVVLTASGGPFRGRSLDEVDRLAPSDALRHPTWRMGERITIDSATLMNKGFEVIEARWLFDVPSDRIRVVVHPQSIVHAMVVLPDGSTIAHLSEPDMRLPIEYVLSYPDLPSARFEPLDLTRIGRLDFEPPDTGRFRCLTLAREALEGGGTLPAVLNAADEVAVAAYLGGRIRFSEIAAVIEETLAAHRSRPADTLDAVLDADGWARREASARVATRARAADTPGPAARLG